MRSPKPWYWKQRKTWCVYIRGQKHVLGPDKDAAHRKFHQLMGEAPKVQPPASPNSVAVVLNSFLAWTKENRAAKTFRGYQDFCQSFDAKYPTLAYEELSPAHVTDWLSDQTTWNSTTKRGAITCLQRAMNWAAKNRGLPNPIRGMDKPPANSRVTVLTKEEFDTLLASVKDKAFQELLIVSYDCGARPQEVKELEKRHVDLKKQRAVLPTMEAKGKRKPRVIYFPTKRALTIIRQLVAEHPEGRIFRNLRGRPWTASAVKCRFDRLQETLGKRYRQYDFRHTWITRKLRAGVDSHIVAALSGHGSTEQLDKTYSHVAEDHKFMLSEAKRA